MLRLRRRQFLLAACALAGVRAAAAPASTQVPRIGFLSPTSPGARDEAFLKGLRDLGYEVGRNVSVEMRFAEGRPERLQGLVEELLARGPDVLAVGATIGALAAKKASSTVPIVFAGASDPVAAGVVDSLARPGGNVTGVSTAYGDDFAGKWLELLKEAAPELERVAVLWSSSNPAAAGFVAVLRAAARASKVSVEAHHAADRAELAKVLAAIANRGRQGLIVTPSPFAETQRDALVRFAAVRRLPAVYFVDGFAEAGGLMSYGPSIVDAYRRAAWYVDRILRGARPAELPVEQPTKFELVVNLEAARALGLVIPRSLMLRADRLIE